jgi:Bacterial archaeo-eukaryotic release factor family 2
VDLSTLEPLFGFPGPYATAYFDATRAEESGAREIALRWRRLRAELAGQGAPDPLLDEMEAAALANDHYPGRHGRIVVGTGKEVVLDEALPHPPQRESAAWAPLPHLLPYVRQHAWTVPHVLAVVDRLGADVAAFGWRSEPRDTREVGGRDLHVRKGMRKVKVGGWAHKQYQRRSENLWEQNAREVAEAVDELVAEVDAHVLAVAGDVRAREALAAHLGARSRAALVDLEHGGRAAGAAGEPLQEELLTQVRRRALDRMSAVLNRFEEQRGRREAAVEGLPEVVDAVRRAQADTVLLRDDPSATTQLWVGPEPLHLGLAAADLQALGVPNPEQDRADAAIVRALAATRGGLLPAPAGTGGPGSIAGLRDGIGALLRYADAATPSG